MTSRSGRRAASIAAAIALVVAGCALIPQQPQETVVIYGRTAKAGETWFGLFPLGDPPQVVGFGSDGAACLTGPAGSTVVSFDGSPGDGGQPRRTLATVASSGGESETVIWVDVAADGSVVDGQGVPDWWVDDPTDC